MPLRHDPEHTAQHFDTYAEREWDRHEESWATRASFAIHCAFLAEFVQPGDRVLDAGAGPGKFTIELAKLGARVHVGDISPVQLRLNADRVRAAEHEDAVIARTVLDICDLSEIEDGRFDAVVCFGGPVSYAMDRAGDAIVELCRVTRPGGRVLVSVMSAAGAVRRFLPAVLAEGRDLGTAHSDTVVRTGYLARATNKGHECRMFRWSELAALLTPHGEIVAASAANFLTAQHDDALDLATDAEREQVLRWELELCREPGALDGGTHIIAVIETPDR